MTDPLERTKRAVPAKHVAFVTSKIRMSKFITDNASKDKPTSMDNAVLDEDLIYFQETAELAKKTSMGRIINNTKDETEHIIRVWMTPKEREDATKASALTKPELVARIEKLLPKYPRFEQEYKSDVKGKIKDLHVDFFLKLQDCDWAE
ncbi:uncharacterized protein [Clytia hemisphaerica]|uniref:Uncharacterized protein n=1 Tax=Clytia hemisphaerica TaxID=252671 RepID=A0A7M5XLV6_9CNID|eukprot:TCONS_00065036-protein